MFWYIVAIVGLFILSALLAPKPKIENAKAAGLSDFNFPMTDEGTPVFLYWGRVRIRAPNVLWYGDFSAKAITKKVKTGMFSSKRQTIGYNYYLGMQLSLGLFTGTGSTLHRIWWGDEEIWDGPPQSTHGAFSVSAPNILGGKEQGGGVGGLVEFYPGRFDQPRSEYLAEKTELDDAMPAYRGLTYMVLRGLPADTPKITGIPFGGIGFLLWAANLREQQREAAIQRAFWVGERPNLDPISVEVESQPNQLGLGPVGEDGDANPSEVLYDIITSDWGRMAIAGDSVDAASFVAAGTQLAEENHGIAYTLNSATDGRDAIEEILKQIDGFVYEEPTTRQIVIKLVREDYNIEELPIFDPSNILEVTDFGVSQWADTYNQTRVVYNDRESDYNEKTAFAQDLSNITIQGRVRSTEVTFPGVSNGTLANFLAARELNYLSIPITTLRIITNRNGAQLRPGDVIKVTWPEYRIDQLICRVKSFDYGELDNGRVAIDLVQDRFAISKTIFTAPPQTEWVRPITQPQNIIETRIIELPKFIVDRLVAAGEVADGGTVDNAYIGYFMRRPHVNTDSFEAQVSTDGNETYAIDQTDGQFCATATLVNEYPLETSEFHAAGFRISNLDDKIVLRTATDSEIANDVVNVALIGDEMIAYGGYTDHGDGTYTLTNVWRGIGDTSPRTHAAGTRMFFFSEGVDQLGENFFEPGDEVDSFAVSQNAFGQSSPFDATLTHLEMQDRVHLPYPPDQLTVESESYPDELPGPDYDLTWVRRNRTATSITKPNAGDEAPSETTEYFATVTRDGHDEEGPEHDLGSMTTSGTVTDSKPGWVTLRVYARNAVGDSLFPVMRRFISRQPFLLDSDLGLSLQLAGNLSNLGPIEMEANSNLILSLFGVLSNLAPIELQGDLSVALTTAGGISQYPPIEIAGDVDVDLEVSGQLFVSFPHLLEAAPAMSVSLTGALTRTMFLETSTSTTLALSGELFNAPSGFELVVTTDLDLDVAGVLTVAAEPLAAGENDFYFTGAPITRSVPDGVRTLLVNIWGGGGATGYEGGFRASGGGGHAYAILKVEPGDEITIEVGEGGNPGLLTSGGIGGWPDGGSGGRDSNFAGGGGGGSTRIYVNGVLRLVAGAGGGEDGGSAVNGSGGDGGGLSGGVDSGFTTEMIAADQDSAGIQGLAGYETRSGDGRFGGDGFNDGDSETTVQSSGQYSGGGGGGYFGGAGGAATGGGGGSGYAANSADFIDGYTTIRSTNAAAGRYQHGYEVGLGYRLSGESLAGSDGKAFIFAFADEEEFMTAPPPVEPANSTGSINNIRARKFIAPEDMWLDTMHFYTGTAAPATDIRGLIFTDCTDGPGLLLTRTATVTGLSVGDNDIPLLHPIFLRRGDVVWIGFNFGGASYTRSEDPGVLPSGLALQVTSTFANGSPSMIPLTTSENPQTVQYDARASGYIERDNDIDFKMAVVPFLTPTATGTLDITDTALGGRVPKAVLIFGGQSPANSTADHVLYAFGAATPYHQMCVSATIEDNQGISDAESEQRMQNNDAVISTALPGETVSAQAVRAAVDSFIADGVRLNFTTVEATQRQFFAVIIAGHDVKAGVVRNSALHNPNLEVLYDHIGFHPTFGVIGGEFSNLGNGDGSNGVFAAGLGFVDKNANQASVNWIQQTSQSIAGRPSLYMSEDKAQVFASHNSAALNRFVRWKSFNADGFTSEANNTITGDDNITLFVHVPGVDARVLSFMTPTTTGVQSITGLGFQPEFALMIGSSAEAFDTPYFENAQASGFGIAAFDEAGGVGLGAFNQATDPSNCGSAAADNVFYIGRDTSATALRADWDGFTADGFDLDWTAVHTSPVTVSTLVLGRAYNLLATTALTPVVSGFLTVVGSLIAGNTYEVAHTGTRRRYIVEAGVSSISVKLWGAGGGGGIYVSGSSDGGGGGFTEATFAVSEGDVVEVEVGGGGGPGVYLTEGGAGGWPDGGDGARGDVAGGGGGGSTRVYINDVLVAVAGAGGGGVGFGSSDGGAGGGTSGQDSGGTTGGSGGTQLAGGNDRSDTSNLGKTGTQVRGGNGFGTATADRFTTTSDDGGGGGGGYWGGGGGGGDGHPGGGGSGYVDAGATSGSTTAGNFATPAGTADPDYPGAPIAVGGTAGDDPSILAQKGGDGYAVITASA